MAQPVVSLTFAGLCALAMFGLVGWVALGRIRSRALFGDAGDRALKRRIRIHANFVEVAPLTGLAMLGAEWTGVGEGWLWSATAVFFAARLVHAVTIAKPYRGIGMVPTMAVPAGLGAWTLWALWG